MTELSTYGCTKNCCSYEAQCFKFGKEHETKKSIKGQNSPPKCDLCAKDHTVNFKGCPAFKSIYKNLLQRFNRQTPRFSLSTQNQIIRKNCQQSKYEHRTNL